MVARRVVADVGWGWRSRSSPLASWYWQRCSLVRPGATTWRDDLVEGRRQLRVFSIVAGTGYALLNMTMRLLAQTQTPIQILLVLPEWASTADAVVLWNLLQANAGGMFEMVSEPRVL